MQGRKNRERYCLVHLPEIHKGGRVENTAIAIASSEATLIPLTIEFPVVAPQSADWPTRAGKYFA